MKKMITLISVFAFFLVALPVVANSELPWQEPEEYPSHVNLYQKTPGGDWPIVENGAWGRLNYTPEGTEFSYVFNGHRLTSGVEYKLVYYPDPWPGNGLICLGEGGVNKGGNIHIEGNLLNTGDLPALYDGNHELNPNKSDTTLDYHGAKIWLVKSADVNCTDARMINWNPDTYLFEENGISFVDTNDANTVLERLENKNPVGWAIYGEDGKYGELFYRDSGPSFQYVFRSYGLDTSKEYSLIYFRDPWMAPKTLIAKATSDSSGKMAFYGDIDLGIDLPDPSDANYSTLERAKVWLVPSSDYNEATNLLGWNPTAFLYDTDLVLYEDTDD